MTATRADLIVHGNAFFLKTDEGLKRLDPIRVRVGETYVDYLLDDRLFIRFDKKRVLHRRRKR